MARRRRLPRTTYCARSASAFLRILTASVCFAATASAHASELPPIQVEADSFRVLVAENKAVWRGDVVATQGSFRFRASRLTIHLDQIGASGADGSDISTGDSTRSGYELSARRLSYDVARDAISGIGDCELRRGAESIQAERIEFDIAAKIATAYPGPDGRVHVQFMTNPDNPVFAPAQHATTAFQAR